MSDSPLKYRRVLLKLSGEALMGEEDYGIDPNLIKAISSEIIEAQKAGATEDVAAADDQRDLGAGFARFHHFLGEAADDLRVDAVVLVAHQRLAGQFEQDAAAGELGHSGLRGRGKRRAV